MDLTAPSNKNNNIIFGSCSASVIKFHYHNGVFHNIILMHQHLNEISFTVIIQTYKIQPFKHQTS